jgi:hypothetical protein
MAGRGYGKTRAGAEWVQHLAEEPGLRIALVGPSVDEVRTVMPPFRCFELRWGRKMRGNRGRGCLANLVASLIIIGVIVSWSDFLFKPLTRTPLLEAGGVAAVVGDLLQPVPTTFNWPLAGYVWLISALLLAFVAAIIFFRPVSWVLRYLEASEAPVSILESKITLHFEDAALRICRVDRSQRMHANLPCIEAYHYNQTAIKGTIDEARIHIDSRIDSDRVTKDLIKRASGKSVEVIETFTRPLPTSYWVTYLSDRVVTMLADSLKLFKKVIVTRTMTAYHLDEYDGPAPLFQMTAIRYPVSSITITLDFPVATAPAEGEVGAYLITSHAVQTVSVVPISGATGRKIFQATLTSLRYKQTFRVYWSNNRLEDVRTNHPHLLVP